MKSFLSLLIAFLFVNSVFAQTTFLSEDFAGGFPPAGWVHDNNSANPGVIGWKAGAQNAWHEDELAVGQCDNILISPVMDLTLATAATLTFSGKTNHASFLANHPNSRGNGVSTVEVSTDGGLTWTVVWTDTSQNDGDEYVPRIDLSAYLGMNNVQIGFHYTGNFAQEWFFDDVVVNDCKVVLTRAGACPGIVTWSVTGASPGGNVVFVFGTPGPFTLPPGPCGGTLLGIIPFRGMRIVKRADALGAVSIVRNMPALLCGKSMQAIDVATCCLSNVVPF